MKLLIIGHTGFLGRGFVNYLDDTGLCDHIVGVSLTNLNRQDLKKVKISEYIGLKSSISEKVDFVFFLSHGQYSKSPIDSESELAQNFINFVSTNNIGCPIVLVKSIGKNSSHIKSRTLFNEKVKESLKNEIFEVCSSIIADDGSVSYEIPKSVVRKCFFIPKFPWLENEVSITTKAAMYQEFQRIFKDANSPRYIVPEHIHMTYKQYLQNIADKIQKKIYFVNFPINDFIITPIIVSFLSGWNYYLVRNLMESLQSDSSM